MVSDGLSPVHRGQMKTLQPFKGTNTRYKGFPTDAAIDATTDYVRVNTLVQRILAVLLLLVTCWAVIVTIYFVSVQNSLRTYAVDTAMEVLQRCAQPTRMHVGEYAYNTEYPSTIMFRAPPVSRLTERFPGGAMFMELDEAPAIIFGSVQLLIDDRVMTFTNVCILRLEEDPDGTNYFAVTASEVSMYMTRNTSHWIPIHASVVYPHSCESHENKTTPEQAIIDLSNGGRRQLIATLVYSKNRAVSFSELSDRSALDSTFTEGQEVMVKKGGVIQKTTWVRFRIQHPSAGTDYFRGNDYLWINKANPSTFHMAETASTLPDDVDLRNLVNKNEQALTGDALKSSIKTAFYRLLKSAKATATQIKAYLKWSSKTFKNIAARASVPGGAAADASIDALDSALDFVK
jgi:hypothetical protein